MSVHQLKEAKGRDVITKCGLGMKVPKNQSVGEFASIWASDVTCKECRGGRRVPVVHE